MIIRIVKLSFAPDKVETFLALFNKYEEKIASVEGCVQLELLNDIHTPNVYFTYSYWQEEAFLEAYRDSDLFNDVWQQTKVLFNDKPQAWSVKRV
ncbi:MAG TPA: antibiotic biosynthesis monooxygenase family protein [Bacteroidia bacterium]|nr:antibiotic biosynthesis monooxygenase family protein [Bacteroidia bacterium]